MTNAGGKTVSFCEKLYDLGIERSPFNFRNIAIIKQAEKIINEEKYDIIHCHTPMGGVVGRISSRTARRNGTRVIYTAHGFHFYKGAPMINWLFYYTMERILARMTDCIITINEEDYTRAKDKFRSKNLQVYKIDGIGVDVSRFSKPTGEEKNNLKKKYGHSDKFLLIYAAEFIPRKNHIFIINALPELIKVCPNIKVLFAGEGILKDGMQETINQRGLSKYVSFLGFCHNMPELYKMSDVVISASIEEGFGINIIEGMASGLPTVASVVRGHKEMVKQNKNGYLFDVKKPDQFCNAVYSLYSDSQLYRTFSDYALLTANCFSTEHSLEQMSAIYKNYIS
jgi:glycosyltransferase EpsD